MAEEQYNVETNNAKTEPEKEKVTPITFLKNRHVSIGKLIGFGVTLLLFLLVTNPGMIPFLPENTKESLQHTWSSVFGDVEKVSQVFVFNWITVFRLIAIILLMIFITVFLQFIFERIHPKSPKARSAMSLLRSTISYVTTFVAIFWCLAALGVNIATIFASVGIVALIIGFGAQSLVEDLVTGIFLVFEDQFNVGDIIEVNDFRGTVEAIGIRTTAIRDVGNNVKIINNSDLRNILNRSTQNSVSVTTVSISYNADLEET